MTILRCAVRQPLQRRKMALHCAMLILIGFIVGSLAKLVHVIVKQVSTAKWEWVEKAVHEGRLWDGCAAQPLAALEAQRTHMRGLFLLQFIFPRAPTPGGCGC